MKKQYLLVTLDITSGARLVSTAPIPRDAAYLGACDVLDQLEGYGYRVSEEINGRFWTAVRGASCITVQVIQAVAA